MCDKSTFTVGVTGIADDKEGELTSLQYSTVTGDNGGFQLGFDDTYCKLNRFRLWFGYGYAGQGLTLTGSVV